MPVISKTHCKYTLLCADVVDDLGLSAKGLFTIMEIRCCFVIPLVALVVLNLKSYCLLLKF